MKALELYYKIPVPEIKITRITDPEDYETSIVTHSIDMGFLSASMQYFLKREEMIDDRLVPDSTSYKVTIPDTEKPIFFTEIEDSYSKYRFYTNDYVNGTFISCDSDIKYHENEELVSFIMSIFKDTGKEVAFSFYTLE